MAMSVMTNSAALQALQGLNATRTQLDQTRERVSTGLKVASARDDGATFAIATRQRSDVSSLGVLQTSLSRAKSVLDVALNAGQNVSDILIEMKKRILTASDTSVDTVSRAALRGDFGGLMDQMRGIVYNASFNGINLITETSKDMVIPSGLGGSVMTVAAQNLTLGVDGLWWNMAGVSGTSNFTTATEALDFLPAMDIAIERASTRLAALGTAAKAIDRQNEALGKLQDSMTAGVGNLVDADLSKESAKLQSLQTKESLAVQALGIANQAPQMLLQLYR